MLRTYRATHKGWDFNYDLKLAKKEIVEGITKNEKRPSKFRKVVSEISFFVGNIKEGILSEGSTATSS